MRVIFWQIHNNNSVFFFFFSILDEEIIKEADHLRITVNDFNLKSIIGKGYFGDVYFSYEISTHDIYAIKKIRKSAILPNIAIKEERDIMVACGKSEWITSLQYAFQVYENINNMI